MTDKPPRTDDRPQTRLTESPLIWICMFGGMAIAALLIISPKYARRHGRLVRQYEARVASGDRSLEKSSEDSRDEATQQERSDPSPRAGDVRGLLIVIGAIVVVSAAGLVLLKLRSHSPTADGPQTPAR